MEKDIKILEEKINNIKKYNTYRYDWTETDIQTVKHLIKAYKELEEENAMFKKVNKITKNITTEEIENAIKEANKKYIPVSLVEEKIEELIKEGRHYNANKIEVLQELLEKRK